MRSFLVLMMILVCLITKGQNSSIYLQLKKDSKFKSSDERRDSLKVLINLKKKGNFFPDTYIVKGQLLGKNSTLVIDLPDSVLHNVESVNIIEAVELASNEPWIPTPEVLCDFNYLPFDFIFKTVPDSALLYLIPLIDWEDKYGSSDISRINISTSQIDQFSRYKINKKKTPVTLKVFEQPYVALFLLGTRISKEYINPKRINPKENIVEIDIK